MKIICPKEELLKGVSIVSKAVPTRTTVTILECIKIDASSDQITLTANDTQFGIETVIEGTIEEKGIVALDARIFEAIVRKLPDSDVTITSAPDFKTEITCENSRTTIIGQSGEDFSPLPIVPKTDPVEISQFTLREVIRQTIFSISQNEANKMMTGEQFRIKDGKLRVVSLDGIRISIRNIELRDNHSDYDVVISGKTLSEISKIIQGGPDDMVKIYISDQEDGHDSTRHIMFEFDQTKIVSALLSGQYYNIDNMFREEYQTKVRINRRQLVDCLDRSTILIKEGDKKPVVMNITDGNMELMISSFIGSMDENIPVQKEGKDLKIAFNPKFYLDALKVIDDEEISIYFINPVTPCFIKDDDENYIYIIIPINF